MFPLGQLYKRDVRDIARRLGLSIHDKKDSTGICFIGERPFREFLMRYLPPEPGEMVTPDGRSVGRHAGLMYYTIGQRQGLGIGGAGEPWYVVAKDIARNVLVVAQGHDHPALFSDRLSATDVNWIAGRLAPLPLGVRGEDALPPTRCALHHLAHRRRRFRGRVRGASVGGDAGSVGRRVRE